MKNKCLTILHIEDDDDHAELLSAATENSRVIERIIRFRDAESCLKYLFGKPAAMSDKTHHMPNLILLDLTLPGMSGLELLRWLRADESTRAIPIIVLASSSSENRIARAYQYGANSYIVKPSGFQDFIVKLAELNMYWNMTSEIPEVSLLTSFKGDRETNR